MIKHSTAKKIAINWHGGQWSAFYQFQCSGYIVENHLRYLQEVETELHPEYRLHPGILNKKDETDLNNLKEYFIAQGKLNGIETLFSTHPVYGYNVPFISEHTGKNILAKIERLKYLV